MERLPSPALIVAFIAVAIALGGVAVAGNGGKVKTGDVDLVEHKVKNEAFQTSGFDPAGNGPAITGRAKKGDLLEIQAQVDIQRLEGGSSCFVFLGIQGAGAGEEGNDVMSFAGAMPATNYLDETSSGTLARYEAMSRTVPVAKDGPFRISLSYFAGHAGTTCEFSKRNLWVEHIR